VGIRSLRPAVIVDTALGFEIYSIVSPEKRCKNDVSCKHRRRYVGINVPLTIGILLEAIGYIARATSANNTEAMMPYVMHSITLLIAPALIATTIYTCLGEIIRSLKGEKDSVISVNYLTKNFTVGDVLSFLMQSSRGGMMAKSYQGSADLGKKLIIISLLCVSCVICMLHHRYALCAWRIHHRPTSVSSSLKHSRPAFGNWKYLLAVHHIIDIHITVISLPYH
jgi:uncharacterized membrane protein